MPARGYELYLGMFNSISKVSEDSLKVVRTLDERFRTLPKVSKDCRRFPKITEDFRGRTDDVSIIRNTSKYFLRDYRNGDLST